MGRLNPRAPWIAAAACWCAFAANADVGAFLDEQTETIRAEHGLPALAAAIVMDGGVILESVAGVRVAGEDAAVEPGDPFHIGSLAKAMTATLLGRLVDDGALGWECALGDVFPEAHDLADGAFAEVTLAQLLRHHGGIAPGTSHNAPESIAMRALEGAPREQRRAAVEILLGEASPGEPGRLMRYSNAGYGLAAAMAEAKTGEAWEDLMRARIFEPLGMGAAGFGWAATPERPHVPRGHWATEEGPVPQPLNDAYSLYPPIAPGGDVHCSIGGLARFAALHLHGETNNGGRLLAPETLQELHAPAGTGQQAKAMGWMVQTVDSETALWHSGSAGTFYAWMTLWPERDLAIVAVANRGDSEAALAQLTGVLFERLTSASEPE